MNNTLLSPRAFRKQSIREQVELQTINFSNWRGYRQEDISPRDKLKLKKKNILLLKKLLSNFDKYYVYSDDSRAYRKGKEQQDEIEKLVKEIGKDGSKIYKKFFEQNEGDKDDLYSDIPHHVYRTTRNISERELKRTR